MQPDSSSQIRFGLGACLAALIVVLVLAFVPDPLFRHREFVTRLDDVAGVQPGTEVYFRGASVGKVSSVELDPASQAFDVRLSVSKRWHPTACSEVSVSAANPLTAPRISLVDLDGASLRSVEACRVARAAQQCDLVHGGGEGDRTLVGCRRQPDLIATAAAAVGEAANVAHTANEMAQRLQAMMTGSGGAGSGMDMAAVAKNATATLAALSSLSTQLDHSFAPGKGDIAMTLSNVRQLSGRAAGLDVASVNGILGQTKQLLAQNQASVAELLKGGAGSATQARATLEGASASLVQASANLDRITDSLGNLSERAAADPTFIIRGQRYTDPPAPGAHK